MTEHHEDLTGPCILIAGPTFHNAAGLVGKWLQSASDIDKLWKQACKDKDFAKSVEKLRLVYEPDFGITAMRLVTRLRYNGEQRYRALIVPLSSEDAAIFAIMLRVGLFERRDSRYEMSIACSVTLESVKAAAQYLASTWEDEYGLHPEYFVEVLSPTTACAWRDSMMCTDLARGIYYRADPRR